MQNGCFATLALFFPSEVSLRHVNKCVLPGTLCYRCGDRACRLLAFSAFARYFTSQACQRAVDDFRTSVRAAEPLVAVVEDGAFHFEPRLAARHVQAHRAQHARGAAARHIGAAFWRKESS